MLQVTLGGLDDEMAIYLARALLGGEEIATERDVAAAIGEQTSGIPFYIHHTVGALHDVRGPVGADDVDAVVEQALFEAADPWELDQYRDRIEVYYDEHRDVALAVLDVLAVAEAPIARKTLCNLVRAKVDADDGAVVAAADLLERDHYIAKRRDGYRFAFAIVARSWRAREDL